MRSDPIVLLSYVSFAKRSKLDHLETSNTLNYNKQITKKLFINLVNLIIDWQHSSWKVDGARQALARSTVKPAVSGRTTSAAALPIPASGRTRQICPGNNSFLILLAHPTPRGRTHCRAAAVPHCSVVCLRRSLQKRTKLRNIVCMWRYLAWVIRRFARLSKLFAGKYQNQTYEDNNPILFLWHGICLCGSALSRVTAGLTLNPFTVFRLLPVRRWA